MASCHLHYLQSIAKTYQATAILKLYEEGKIDLDEKHTGESIQKRGALSF